MNDEEKIEIEKLLLKFKGKIDGLEKLHISSLCESNFMNGALSVLGILGYEFKDGKIVKA